MDKTFTNYIIRYKARDNEKMRYALIGANSYEEALDFFSHRTDFVDKVRIARADVVGSHSILYFEEERDAYQTGWRVM